MRKVKVSLNKHSYQIMIGSGVSGKIGHLSRALKLGTDAYIITNPAVKRYCAAGVIRSLRGSGISLRIKVIPEGESSKDLKFAGCLVQDLARFDLRRRTFIIALGGGVIGDLGGFVASIYKRGIPYIQVPTTLLAQVDSSIGGKTAVDLENGKNLVGAFYQPRLVLCDIALLKTLSKKQISGGLAEVIKYGIIKDEKLFRYVEKNYKDILDIKDKNVCSIVESCARIKSAIVSIDEKEEKGVRTALNFGHTIGHAIEASSGYRYSHGESVSLGMLAALSMSARLRLTDFSLFERTKSLLRNCRLPFAIKGLSTEKIIKAHYRDKKFCGRRNKFVLSCGLGRIKIVNEVPLNIIRLAVGDVLYKPTSRN